MHRSKWTQWIVPIALLVTSICASVMLISGLSQAAAPAA
jgi:hypothetical protein